MNHAEIHQKLTEVFRDVFDDPGIEISDTTTANDIDGWDSITHVVLITATEKAFNVRFNTRDVKALANVGDFIRLIESRSGKA
jgi:acyl carrier protein